MAKRIRKRKVESRVSYPGLLNDVIFKIVFGGTQSEAVLKCLLNALLVLQGGDRIVALDILSPNPEKFYFDDKGPVLDLKARDEKGTHYNVEVQLRAAGLSYVKRSLYYTTRLYSEQLKSGHRAQDFKLTEDLELHYIELPKFTPDKPRALQTRFERWLYILKFSDLYHTRELPENLREEEGIQMAIDSMRKAYARDVPQRGRRAHFNPRHDPT